MKFFIVTILLLTSYTLFYAGIGQYFPGLVAVYTGGS